MFVANKHMLNLFNNCYRQRIPKSPNLGLTLFKKLHMRKMLNKKVWNKK